MEIYWCNTLFVGSAILIGIVIAIDIVFFVIYWGVAFVWFLIEFFKKEEW